MKRALCASVLTLVLAGPSYAADLSVFAGSWSGSAQGKKADGKPEAFKCNAINGWHDGRLSIAMTCASASIKVVARAKIRGSRGGVSGTWEIVDPSYEGNLSGTVSGQTLIANLSHAAFKGRARVSRTGSGLSVSLSLDTGLTLAGTLGRR